MASNETILDTQLVAPTTAAPAALAPRFTVGGVVATTIRVWWKHVLAFTSMSIVVYAPFAAAFGLLFATAWLARPDAPPQGELFAKLGAAFAVVWLLTIALMVIQAGAVAYGTVRHLAGERARFGEMLGIGLRRGLPVVGVGILVWLAVLGASLLLLVPGIILAVATSVAIPAAVVERSGAVGAFKRSLALTRGYRWGLFAAWLAIMVVVWVLAAVVQIGATVISSILLPPQQAMVGTIIASQLGNAFFSAIPIVGISVAYHDLRVAKEGVDTAALVKVFE